MAMQIDPSAPSPYPLLTPDSLAASSPALPAVTQQTALFLDFDGTLVEIASQPELVQVPKNLVDTLRHLAGRLDGALAIVSGRRLADLDGFLAPLLLPAAAEHGAVQRLSSDRTVHLATPDLHDIARVALALAAQHAGLHVEIKSAAIALHYRHAPGLETLCLETMAEAVKRTPGVDLMQGKCVVEIKPAGVSKGTAIQSFMSLPPFAGRVPVFAGDDTTDEAGFAAVQAMGGQGIKVGAGDSLAEHRCASPARLRQWLQSAFEERTGA
ncbi:MAG: trehalose-phosphatase [Pseudomonadota bacterium]